MELYCVYELIDPRDELPFYVGISNNPDQRYTQHMNECIVNPEKQRRIHSIRDAGMDPGMRIIEKWGDRKLAIERERYWVLAYIDWGIPLTNVNYTEHFTQRPSSTLISVCNGVLNVRISDSPHNGFSRKRKAVGWLQYFEIDDIWDIYLQKRGVSDSTTSIEDLDQFMASFSPPPRIPVLRERDKRNLRIWYDQQQWKIRYPNQVRIPYNVT